MTETRKIKEKDGIEYYELDTSKVGKQQFISTDLTIHNSAEQAKKQTEKVTEEHLFMEPGTLEKKLKPSKR